ncbi:MAG TPA: hypothetical protein V6C58_05420 [Allocoleopsis sp.]
MNKKDDDQGKIRNICRVMPKTHTESKYQLKALLDNQGKIIFT